MIRNDTNQHEKVRNSSPRQDARVCRKRSHAKTPRRKGKKGHTKTQEEEPHTKTQIATRSSWKEDYRKKPFEMT